MSYLKMRQYTEFVKKRYHIDNYFYTKMYQDIIFEDNPDVETIKRRLLANPMLLGLDSSIYDKYGINKHDNDVLNHFIISTPEIIRFIGKPTLEMKELAVAKGSYSAIQYLLENNMLNEDLLMLALLTNGFIIRLIDNPEPVHASCAINGYIECPENKDLSKIDDLVFVIKKLGLLTDDLLAKACSINSSCLKYYEDNKIPEEVALSACNAKIISKKIFKLIPNQTDEMHKIVMIREPKSIQYMNNPSHDVIKYVTNINPELIKFIKEPPEDIVLSILKRLPKKHAHTYINKKTDKIKFELALLK